MYSLLILIKIIVIGQSVMWFQYRDMSIEPSITNTDPVSVIAQRE